MDLQKEQATKLLASALLTVKLFPVGSTRAIKILPSQALKLVKSGRYACSGSVTRVRVLREVPDSRPIGWQESYRQGRCVLQPLTTTMDTVHAWDLSLAHWVPRRREMELVGA